MRIHERDVVIMRYQAEEETVRVLGRTIMKDGVRYLGYSCSAIEFQFVGRKADAVLVTDSDSRPEEHYAWLAVFINDETMPSKRFCLSRQEDSYVLYEGEEEALVTIRLVKYSESAFGMVGIKSIGVDGSNPIRPTQSKNIKLEFIGDSITCGYGIEGKLGIDSFNTAQENPWKAYAARTARALDADYNLVSWSGIGIISAWTDQEEPITDWLMPELYAYTDKAMDIVLGNKVLAVWDNSHFIPDCIIMNIGTNDASYTRNMKDRVALFGNKYYAFLKQVRELNPETKILCTLGVMGQELFGEIEYQISRLQSEGYEGLYSMVFELQNELDGIGCDWHPSSITHEKMAARLEDKLRSIL